MRKSREFDNMLDECLERLLVKDETIEQCLRSFPKYADELKPLLETALATKQASAIQPRPEFRDRARYQFYSALQEMGRKESRPFFSWGGQPRWAAVVAITLVLLLTSGGTVAAASGSMPDEPLYPVKLATEQAQLALTPSTLGKAELYTKLTERRVAEIVRMANESKPEQIERTVRRLDTYLTKIAILSSTQEVTGVAMAPAAEEVLTAEETPAVEETPPVKEAPVFEKAPAAKEAIVARKAPVAKKAPVLVERATAVKEARFMTDRRARLRAIMVRDATKHPARLRALLKTVPDSARPALLRAIAVSEKGYEKALKSLD